MYDYKKEKQKVFLEENQKDFLETRDNILILLNKSGVALMSKLLFTARDNYLGFAFVDRLVELKEIREVKDVINTFEQYDRIFGLSKQEQR
jgi:hypothetical protein